MAKHPEIPAGSNVIIESKPATIAPTTLIRTRPKVERSEKQKECLARLIEANKKRALARKGVVDTIPETIAEDQTVVTVRPKRQYNRKKPAWNSNASLVKKKDDSDYEVERIPASETESEIEEKPRRKTKEVKEEKKDLKKTIQRAVKETIKKTIKKTIPKKKTYDDTTSVTSLSSSDESESDDEKTKKYIKKADRRMQKIQEIESKLKTVNPYVSRGLSLWS